LFLSVWGYLALGYEDKLGHAAFLNSLPDPVFENWFLDGMEYHGADLQDPSRLHWDHGYRVRMHALVLMAGADVTSLNKAVHHAEEEMGDFGRGLCKETGTARRRGKYAVEHFGFADGISQPVFFKGEAGAEGPKIVLEKDPLADDPDAFGSYLVFRKLEQ